MALTSNLHFSSSKKKSSNPAKKATLALESTSLMTKKKHKRSEKIGPDKEGYLDQL
jgi:hypothetical protein